MAESGPRIAVGVGSHVVSWLRTPAYANLIIVTGRAPMSGLRYRGDEGLGCTSQVGAFLWKKADMESGSLMQDAYTAKSASAGNSHPSILDTVYRAMQLARCQSVVLNGGTVGARKSTFPDA